MDRTFVLTNSFEQEGSVAINDAVSSQTWSIIFSETVSIERQKISKLQNTLQVTVPKGASATQISVRRQIIEERIIREFEGISVVTTEHPYIVRDPKLSGGEPVIEGTGIHVRTLVGYWRAGTPPEDLLLLFPLLTLAQVFDALSYYQDHQQEIQELRYDINRPTPSALRARLHQRTPVVPEISPADVIRELRDEP